MSFFFNDTEVTQLAWNAPTQNTDGSAVQGPLTYNVYVDDVNVSAFPGTLAPDGRYVYPLDQVAALADDGVYVIALTAVDVDGDESGQSNTVSVRRGRVPNAPTGLVAI